MHLIVAHCLLVSKILPNTFILIMRNREERRIDTDKRRDEEREKKRLCVNLQALTFVLVRP